MPEESSGELASLLDQFLVSQDRLDRALFLGRYWYSYSVKDLAQRTDLTVNAVSKRLQRTRERLRTYLEERGYHV